VTDAPPAAPRPAVPAPAAPPLAASPSVDSPSAEPVVVRVHRLLRERGETVAVAESLTGGLLSAALVEPAGASETFRGGLVVYATDLKARLAGVSPALLDERGPVDGDVAEQLADGARQRCAADWGVSTTGVAGPDPQGGEPPGTVWVATAWAGGARARRLALDGSRSEIRRAAVAAALDLLAAALDAGGPAAALDAGGPAAAPDAGPPTTVPRDVGPTAAPDPESLG
jgi:nicotinamide-nucleotide amidase